MLGEKVVKNQARESIRGKGRKLLYKSDFFRAFFEKMVGGAPLF
jgi:hypothetical protein